MRWITAAGALALGTAAVLLLLRQLSQHPATEAMPVILRGHEEVVLDAGGRLLPLVLEGPVGLCLDVPATVDTSQWEARLRFDGIPSPTGFAPPAARMGTTVCFDGELPADLEPDPLVEVCAELVDRFDGTTIRIPCEATRYAGQHRRHDELTRRLYALLGNVGQDLHAVLADLDSLRSDAEAAGLPLLAVRCELIAAYFLGVDGTEESLALVRARLDRLPDWLDEPAATSWAAVVAYERSQLEIRQRGYYSQRAWQLLEESEQLYRRVADERRLTAAISQSDLIAAAGAIHEGFERLRAALDDCARCACEKRLLPHAHSQLAWLTLGDPYASAEERTTAEQHLEVAIGAMRKQGDRLELANELVNMAYLQVRQGHDPTQALSEARAALERTVGEETAAMLRAWTDLVEGLGALRTGDLGRALQLCSAVAEGGAHDDLVARAFSCQAQAYRRLGEFSAAESAIEKALVLHDHAAGSELARSIPLGPGQRADDCSRAARIAIEQGDVAHAWQLLVGLDSLFANEAERRRCRAMVTDPALLERWQEIDAETAALLQDLITLDVPVSGERRRQLLPVRRAIMKRLQDLSREWPGCERAAGPQQEAETGLVFRAFALEDEVLLLRRSPEGRISLERRTTMARDELRRICDRVATALQERDLDEQAWRKLLQPLARALLPDRPGQLGAVSFFALHGLLQQIPLAALPLDEPEAGAGGWLCDVTTVALLPAGAGGAQRVERVTGRPLFVVDPRSNLPGAGLLRRFYRTTFPTATFLEGSQATREAVRSQLRQASWLHIDSHGVHDPTFPELSSLLLADGPLTLLELADLPCQAELANLSGCNTGRWPSVAGSGHYGIAGLLARSGVAWVIASRTELEEGLATEHNRVLYRGMAAGMTPPAAYAGALCEVRKTHPVSAWAALLLIRGK